MAELKEDKLIIKNDNVVQKGAKDDQNYMGIHER
jgi:hypothetical protein